MNRLTRAQTGALLLLVGLVTFVAMAVIYPLWSRQHELAAVAAGKQHQLGIYQALAAQKQGYTNQLRTLRNSSLSNAFYLKGETSALATAEMQRQLKVLASRNSSELISTQILNTTEQDTHQRASLRVHMRMDVYAMAKVIHALESGKPMYFIENLSIDAKRSSARSGTNVVETTSLDVKFDLHTYMVGAG